MNATSMTVTARQNSSGIFPTRGRVGMFALIAAESAIFTIFVVAYLFYIGKSLTGPTPKRRSQCPNLLHRFVYFRAV